MLKRFAQMMKWPNLGDTLEQLKQQDHDMSLDDVSSDAFAFFSGLILPGVSLDIAIGRHASLPLARHSRI